jgi:hypothetical protein
MYLLGACLRKEQSPAFSMVANQSILLKILLADVIQNSGIGCGRNRLGSQFPLRRNWAEGGGEETVV